MRISDWSSDVCSSDLGLTNIAVALVEHHGATARTGIDRLRTAARGHETGDLLLVNLSQNVVEMIAAGTHLFGEDHCPIITDRFEAAFLERIVFDEARHILDQIVRRDRKSKRLNSSH